jgi:hypothetical protein
MYRNIPSRKRWRIHVVEIHSVMSVHSQKYDDEDDGEEDVRLERILLRDVLIPTWWKHSEILDRQRHVEVVLAVANRMVYYRGYWSSPKRTWL